jgi:ribonuclease P protein component
VAKFPKSVRLLKHADFKRVYENGKRQFSANLTVFFLRRDHEVERGAGPRVGITVGRALGGAVQRNRIKRRVRETVRSRIDLLGQSTIDVVINPKKSALRMEFAALDAELGNAFQAVVRRAKEQKLESVQ